MTDYVYAVLDGDDNVTNIVAADNDDAVQVLRMLIPEAANIILTTEATGQAYIGGDMLDGKFRMPSPYPSWQWDADTASWVAPIPYPQGGNGYLWDEGAVAWVEIPPAAPIEPDPAEDPA